MKIGLFFGSFNPIHNGHLAIAEYFAQNTDLDEVCLIVSPQNPLKEENTLMSEKDRLAMVKLAIGKMPKITVSDVEFNLPKPSYTYKTLQFLQQTNPRNQYVLLMGADNLVNFDKWKNHQEIIDNFEIYIYPRPNIQPNRWFKHKNVKYFQADLMDISSTFVRNNLQNPELLKNVLPEKVLEYFLSKKL